MLRTGFPWPGMHWTNASEDKSFGNLGLFSGHFGQAKMLVAIPNKLEIIRGLTQNKFVSCPISVLLIDGQLSSTW